MSNWITNITTGFNVVRAVFTMTWVGIAFLMGDLIQRTVILAIITLRPSWRGTILGHFGAVMRAIVMNTVRGLGGAQIERVALPHEPGVLVVMNHQSILDITIAFEMFDTGYPLVVTRKRYSRGIPLVSYMLKLYRHPLVDPREPTAPQLAMLREVGRTAERPVVIFPEGGRTRDGEIRPFKTGGLKALLGARRWRVYVVTVDGLWRRARFSDVVRGLSLVRSAVRSKGPIDFDPERDDADTFIERVREIMCDTLEEIRGGALAPRGER